MEHVSITRSLAMNQKPGGAIVGIRGSNLGKILRIQPEIEVLLGRDSEKCDVYFSDPKVSRIHCSVVYHLKENVYSIYDYSSNGVFLTDGSLLKRGVNDGILPGSELWLGTPKEAVKLG